MTSKTQIKRAEMLLFTAVRDRREALAYRLQVGPTAAACERLAIAITNAELAEEYVNEMGG